MAQPIQQPADEGVYLSMYENLDVSDYVPMYNFRALQAQMDVYGLFDQSMTNLSYVEIDHSATEALSTVLTRFEMKPAESDSHIYENLSLFSFHQLDAKNSTVERKGAGGRKKCWWHKFLCYR